jgi:hypothetical protein
MTWFRTLDDALDGVGLPGSAAEDMVVLERPPIADDDG